MLTSLWSLSCQGQPEPHFNEEAWLHVAELSIISPLSEKKIKIFQSLFQTTHYRLPQEQNSQGSSAAWFISCCFFNLYITSGKLEKASALTCDGVASHPGPAATIFLTLCHRNQDKLQQLVWVTSQLRTAIMLL